MKNIRIVADSTCDLSPELIEKYNITIIPLCIIMDDKSYYDGFEVTPDEIFAWADKNKTTPKTAAIPFDLTEEKLAPFIENGDDQGTIRVRLRSRFVHINSVAEHYRGGGHACASGATVYGQEEMNALLREADALVKDYKENNEGWL